MVSRETNPHPPHLRLLVSKNGSLMNALTRLLFARIFIAPQGDGTIIKAKFRIAQQEETDAEKVEKTIDVRRVCVLDIKPGSLA